MRISDWSSDVCSSDLIHDNIVAFWVPQEPAQAGTSYDMRYRLHWFADEPYPARNVARCVATRIGRGGEPGKPRPPGLNKFVVEFDGDALRNLPKGSTPEPVIATSRGEQIGRAHVRTPVTNAHFVCRRLLSQ